ncbi:MAG: hypothetical protein ABMA00_00055 [Gemmatimonas sp.]
MKLLLRRSERSSITGKPIYMLEVRTELSAEEGGWIEKYRFGNQHLYVKKPMPDDANPTSWGGVGMMLLHHALNITVSVNDLKNGKKIECKDIMEMLAAEEQIKEAARNFAAVLRAASQFGGEEVIDI